MNPLPVAFVGMPGGLEWLVIGLVALLLFGKRLPGIARSLGQALTEFKSGLSGLAGGDEADGAAPAELEPPQSGPGHPSGRAVRKDAGGPGRCG